MRSASWGHVTPLLVGLVMALGACTAQPQQQGGTVASASAAGCPPLRSYSDDLRKRALAELDLLPGNSAVEEMLNDYAVLRQQIRACQP